MSLLESLRAAENRPARLFFAAAAGALFLSLASAAIPAGAQTECHAELSFDSVHLLNNGQNDTAGPFSIDIDAGTYTIIVESFDDHDAQTGIGTQPEEQFYLVLDSGYRSPATNDIADDQNSVSTTFTGQVIDASSSLVLDHARLGGVNSVWPRSVCFVQEVPAETAPAVDCATAPDAVVGQDDVEAIEAVADVAVAVDGCDEAEVVDCSAADAAADVDAANNEVAVDGCDEAEVEPVADCATTGADDDADKVGVADGDANDGRADVAADGDVANNDDTVVDGAVDDTAHADVAATTCDDADEETAGDATAEAPAPEVIIVEVPGVVPDPIVIEVPAPAPEIEVIMVEVPGVVPDPIVIEVPAPAPEAEVIIVEAAAPVVEAPVVDAAARDDEAETSPAADVVAAAPVDEPAVSDVSVVEAAAPAVEAPVGDTAVNTDAAASPTAGDVAVEVAGVVEVAVPEGQVAAAQTDSSAGPAIAAVAQTDVGGDVLAITGSDAWKLLVMMAIVLMAAGVLCMRWGRVI